MRNRGDFRDRGEGRFWDQQWVKCVPPLPVHNRFSYLEDNNETPGVFPIQTEEPVIVTPETLPSPSKT